MTNEPVVYAKLSKELDDIVVRLSANDVSIDEAIALHARGKELIAKLEAYLKSAENTINKL